MLVSSSKPCQGQKQRSSSQNFHGLCFDSTNGGHICQTEGFPDGHCKGFRLRCFCTRFCNNLFK
ncbi:putative knottin, scorpion toxin [Lupinus albus]|uniref:Putative knottin, scorpion toxin n=1 Tax=Lupinus albus TaxID=3870 RepID=A0A6A4QKA4_LUPAL|nr:putative knottin, scorpion toxin [Lupinus albus]